MLETRELTAFNLAPLDFRLEAGECVVVTGPSGAGKTVLLRAIADLDPSEGEVLLEDEARSRMAAPDWRRRVGYLAAEPGWWADTVAAHFTGRPAELVEALGLPAGILDRPVDPLSTGERQRLAFIRMLEREPRVLLLDEPSAALDAESTDRFERLFRECLDKGAAAVLVSHSGEQARRLARRGLHIEDGRITERQVG